MTHPGHIMTTGKERLLLSLSLFAHTTVTSIVYSWEEEPNKRERHSMREDKL